MPTAIKFFNSFISETAEQITLDMYKHDATKFTQSITGIINTIITGMGYIPENEYYRIDAIGWSDKKADNEKDALRIGLKPHLWDLQIAVEHENDLTDWTDELIKLVHICCPLKVIIGYQHCDCRQDHEVEKLAYAAKWMQQVNAFERSRFLQDQYLIILGDARGMNHPSEYKSFDYRGYLFNYGSNCFERIRESASKQGDNLC